MLFNTFAGRFDCDGTKRILLPLAPEYIGYTDIGLIDDMIISKAGKIAIKERHSFKYLLDLTTKDITKDVGLVCISRPTNPTGNVITNDELENLFGITRESNVPLIIDGAYGLPFPHIIFTDAVPKWQDHVILCLSLSKLGLPGLRTGVVIADEETAQTLSAMNAIFSLANNSFGAELIEPLIRSGEIFDLSVETIKPFYAQKSQVAQQKILECFDGIDFYLHESEGAIFLWLWFPGLPISDITLYERLKARGVLVLPGSYFFPNPDPNDRHQRECIRLSYAGDSKMVAEGIRVIGEEVRIAFSE